MLPLRTGRNYADGSEELYDHSKDPNEWNNLADNPEFAPIKRRMAANLPKTPAKILGSNSTGHDSYAASMKAAERGKSKTK